MEATDCLHQLEFGRRLRRLRIEARLSQEEFATLCGLHRTYIGSVERGERNVTLTTILTIASALKVEPADLIPSPQAFFDHIEMEET